MQDKTASQHITRLKQPIVFVKELTETVIQIYSFFMALNKFNSLKHGKLFIVRPSGYLSDETGGLLYNQLLAAVKEGYACFLVDLTEVTVINSPGVTRLLEIAEDLTAVHHSELSLCGVSELYREIFQVTGLASLATIYDSEQEALTALG